MFGYILKKLHFWQLLNQYSEKENNTQEPTQAKLSNNLKENLNLLRGLLGTSYDVVMREFSFGDQGQIQGALVFLEGMTDRTIVNESILKPLMHDRQFIGKNELSGQTNLEVIKNTVLSVGLVEEVTTIDEIIDDCLSGSTILLINNSNQALVIITAGWETRGVEEPKTETVVRGPREGFTESLLINTTLLRRKLKNPNLSLETMSIGKQTKTKVCIVYLKGLANPRLIEEIQRRLKRINTDAILESGYIEQFIEDAPFSIFTQVGNSEKPDTVAAKLLEGRAAIMVDGTPFVLTIPMLFIEGFQSAEDYYSRPYFSNVVRLLRFVAFSIAILAPAIYVALTTFHQELIPTPLLLSMASAQEGVPLPAVGEALIMGVIFEILREAGIRLPRPVGQAISIVGALVIGEAAVSAGLIAAPMVIVVALTAVSSFVVPVHVDSGGVLRVIFTILAGFMGGIGIMFGLIGVLIHLSSLRSFGTPYLSPLAPLSVGDLKDTFIRVPLWAMLTRPRTIGWHDPQRQEFRLKPTPPTEQDKE